VSAASGGNSELEHFGNADAVPQPPERCLSRKTGIVRCCHKTKGGIPNA